MKLLSKNIGMKHLKRWLLIRSIKCENDKRINLKDGRVIFKMFGQHYGVKDFYFTFKGNTKKKLCISFGDDNFLSIDVDDIKSVQNSFYLNTGELVI